MSRDLDWAQGLKLSHVEARRILEHSLDPVAVRSVQVIDELEKTLQTKIEGLDEVNFQLAGRIEDLEQELAKSHSQRERELLQEVEELKWQVQRQEYTLHNITQELREYRARYQVWNILRTADIDSINTSDL